MKYKLINTKTKEEHLCDKVTIDGFSYYVSDKYARIGNFITDGKAIEEVTYFDTVTLEYSIKPNGRTPMSQKRPSLKWGNISATNNPNIDIPKVVDEVEMMALLQYPYPLDVKDKNDKIIQTKGEKPFNHAKIEKYRRAFVIGYNKSQQTHPFSEEDMVDFIDFVEKSIYDNEGYTQFKTNKELLQLWKEQQPKIVYYE
jgi:hypothetical protein